MFTILRYWSPVLIVLGLIFFLSSIPGGQVPKFEFLSFPNADKVEHSIIYALLGFSLCRALTWKIRDLSPSYAVYKNAIWMATLIGAVYGISDEFHQSFVPGRDVEVYDAMADAFGACLGAFLTIAYRRWGKVPH